MRKHKKITFKNFFFLNYNLFTFSGHLGQQLVCQFLREVHGFSETQGSIRPFHAEKLQILAHASQTQVCQGRGRCIVLRNTKGLGLLIYFAYNIANNNVDTHRDQET